MSSFIGALLWAALAALLFQPLFQRLLARWPERRNRAALVTLLKSRHTRTAVTA